MEDSRTPESAADLAEADRKIMESLARQFMRPSEA
jgi:hypothetical protein